jgi:DNA-binding CsgD family transcriptional regulator
VRGGGFVLTVRESEIATLVALGRPAKRIAAILNLSVHTVEKHIENAAAKLPNPHSLPARGVICEYLHSARTT